MIVSRLATPKEIHANVDWRTVLCQLGIDSKLLRDRHSPCPGCGGLDRFRFDNREGRGTWICSGGGADLRSGDGFSLLQHCYGWTFAQSLAAVRRVLDGSTAKCVLSPLVSTGQGPTRNSTRLIRDLFMFAKSPEDVPDVVAYLSSRNLWPLQEGTEMYATPSLSYYSSDRKLIGHFPAILALVRDIDGKIVTVHCTYLDQGQKIEHGPPRKLFSPVRGHRGCAVQLLAAQSTLGVAEGIESALAAQLLHGVPVWACVSAALLAKFEPPAAVEHLIVFADRDDPGLAAARRLSERLNCEVRIPPAPAKDWADVIR